MQDLWKEDNTAEGSLVARFVTSTVQIMMLAEVAMARSFSKKQEWILQMYEACRWDQIEFKTCKEVHSESCLESHTLFLEAFEMLLPVAFSISDDIHFI